MTSAALADSTNVAADYESRNVTLFTVSAAQTCTHDELTESHNICARQRGGGGSEQSEETMTSHSVTFCSQAPRWYQVRRFFFVKLGWKMMNLLSGMSKSRQKPGG